MSRFEAFSDLADPAGRSWRGNRASAAALGASKGRRWPGRAALREPGIGKSRVAAELQDRLRAEPHIRLSYFGSPHHRDSPLHPFVAHLEGTAGISREDLPATRLEKLEALLLQSEESPAETFALLADLLSLPNEGGQPVPAIEP